MSKRSKTTKPTPAVPAGDNYPVVRTTHAPDGARLEFTVSPLWHVFNQQCDALKASGFAVPQHIVEWFGRFSVMFRVNGGAWQIVDTGPATTADC